MVHLLTHYGLRPSLNMPVQRLKVAILSLDLPCCGAVTHSGEILTTGKSHVKKPDFSSLNIFIPPRKFRVKLNVNCAALIAQHYKLN